MSIAFSREMLVAGGGIGGLAGALACTRAGWRARVFERCETFAEAGAGLQLGPNATRLLHAWGLERSLAAVAAFPERLAVHGAASHRQLGRLRLGGHVARRYGAPYATLHRADLHTLLLDAVHASGEVALHLDTEADTWVPGQQAITLLTSQPGTGGGRQREVEGDALLLADGLWSRLRAQAVQDGEPRVTGHVAYRTLLRQASLPAALRSMDVTVWLGDRLHALAYPVRGDEWLNLVLLVQHDTGAAALDPRAWDQSATAAEVARALAGACTPLRALQEAAPAWRRWLLCDRPPLRGPEAMAFGRIALLGDAAHPMLPYLAQGAGMAIEDAAELQRVLAMGLDDVALCLRRYALHRWQRVARVQATAARNGEVFHARGPLRWGRDLAMGLLGERLLDQAWLWSGG